MRKAPDSPAPRTKVSPDLELRIGISGWTYPPWRGVFYPSDLTHKNELHFASREVNSIEINGSFYSMQRPSSYRRWHDETPDDFVFSIKGPRFITHMKKLRDVKIPLANFFASGILALRHKLGPILWQFPPNFGWNEARFREFFALLPRTSAEAAKLGRHHNDKIKERAWIKVRDSQPLRHAVEIRHTSFLNAGFLSLLRQNNIAFVFADTAGKWPYSEDLTADFIYCRLHGAEELYVSGYTNEALAHWEARIRKWRLGKQPVDAKLTSPSIAQPGHRDVYVYFDNDAKVHAPFDARRLAKRLGL